MHHIAILTKKKDYITKILDHQKTIESRWYVNKIAPFNVIKIGETIYLKNTGEPITAKVRVKNIIQYEDLNQHKIKELIRLYGAQIAPECSDKDWLIWITSEQTAKKRYCILIELCNPQAIKPFNINKKGFGTACAWMCVKDIKNCIVKSDKQ
jgi:hypothetical protein